ncbi:MAG: ankyrin repeat domain-containing protein, partial [Alphaproteobacteria bacterium]|nr:ankyrin repeat domain-containing protein [Alphaproteobacteria bacterium]
DVNAKTNGGRTALIIASHDGDKEIVELLIEKGADVNAKANGGSTALMRASRDGYTDVAEVLIQNGADVNQKNNSGQNAMMVAYNEEIKKVIIDAVKKRNEKTGENVVVQGIERE